MSVPPTRNPTRLHSVAVVKVSSGKAPRQILDSHSWLVYR